MLYIVTPVFNRKEFTRSYLNALSDQTNKDFKTIIIDDGSTDGTSDMVEQEFSDVILLREKGDLWWAEATNIGVRYAIKQGATYIMTLNNDTVPKSDFIEKMIDAAKIKPKSLLGAFAIDILTGKPIYGGEYLNWKTRRYENLLDSIPEHERKGLKKVNVFPGRGLLIPCEVFERIGFYDSKNFPQTAADDDFAIRANNAGYEIFCNYDAKISIYAEESGGITLIKNRSWKNYYQHLFGMKGSANLKWFTIFVFKNAPKKYLIQFWIVGVLKRIIAYPYRWFKESIKGHK